MSFVSTDPQSHKGETNTWLTPLWLIKELGEFDLDPCGFDGHNTAKRIIVLPRDGLYENWFGRIWLNPPYGREARDWLAKLQKHGDGIALVFARLETSWLQPYLKNGFFIIKGRLKFLDQSMLEQSNAGTGSILIPFGRKNIGAILSSNIEGEWFQ